MVAEILNAVEAHLKENGYTVEGPRNSIGQDAEQLVVYVEGWNNPVIIDIWGDNLQLYQQRSRSELEATVPLSDPDMFDLLIAAMPTTPDYD